MTASLKTSGKNTVEVVAVLGIYLLFLAVGVYSGQTTMNIDIINPTERSQLQPSPVELVTKVTVRGAPLANVTTRFTIHPSGTGEMHFQIVTGVEGVAKLVFPAWSGSYTWYVTASKQGYPTIMSRSGSFSVMLSIVVDGLLPSTQFLAVSPVDFKARVRDMGGLPVESANVTFYVDSTVVGWSVTGPNGIARLSTAVAPGEHEWFASANKDGVGGISLTTTFVVGGLEYPPTGQYDSPTSVIPQLGDGLPRNAHRLSRKMIHRS